MMNKPLIVMDQHFRRLEELFHPETYHDLAALCDIEGGHNWAMDAKRIDHLIDHATFYISAFPQLNEQQLTRADKLQAVIEVAGGFSEGLAYDACFARGIEVLSSAPGFRQSVAEMTLAMALAGARGLVQEHEAFRQGSEHWQDEREESDFSLYGESVGFIGYGQIARETSRLMAPFNPRIYAYDPFLTEAVPGVSLCELETLVAQCRIVIVAAVPSEETRNLLHAEHIANLRPGALVILISRAWCVDFAALLASAEAGKIRLATDVFPQEPVLQVDPLRKLQNVILSPHRAAAVQGGRQLIGEMILDDVRAILDGRQERRLKPADPDQITSLVAAQKGMAAK